jgi:kynurenine formamidase
MSIAAPVTSVIDLSVPLMPGDGEPVSPRIRHHTYRAGAVRMALSPMQDKASVARTARNFVVGMVTGRRIRGSDFPDGLGLGWESLRTETHHGTHVDAPAHYGPTTAGRPARTIDQLPLEWFFAPGVRLDLRAKPIGSTVTVGDLERALDRIGYELQGGEIVMLWTGADAYWGHPDYLRRYCGLGGDGTRWLLDRGIRIIGIDAWSLDRPPCFIGRDFVETGDRSYLWPAHLAGREREYCQIEKLANLQALPRPTGFTVACFPTAIKGATGGWTRAVAILDDGDSAVRDPDGDSTAGGRS